MVTSIIVTEIIILHRAIEHYKIAMSQIIAISDYQIWRNPKYTMLLSIAYEIPLRYVIGASDYWAGGNAWTDLFSKIQNRCFESVNLQPQQVFSCFDTNKSGEVVYILYGYKILWFIISIIVCVRFVMLWKERSQFSKCVFSILLVHSGILAVDPNKWDGYLTASVQIGRAHV